MVPVREGPIARTGDSDPACCCAAGIDTDTEPERCRVGGGGGEPERGSTPIWRGDDGVAGDMLGDRRVGCGVGEI